MLVYKKYRQILQQSFDLLSFRGTCMSCSGLHFFKEVGDEEQLKASLKLPEGEKYLKDGGGRRRCRRLRAERHPPEPLDNIACIRK